MLKISGSEKVELAMGTFNPSNVFAIEKTCIYSLPSEEYVHLEIVSLMKNQLSSNLSQNNLIFRVKWGFQCVKNLKILPDYTENLSFLGFFIDDISLHQNEDISWKVGSYENDSISFLCNHIEILECYKINVNEL